MRLRTPEDQLVVAEACTDYLGGCFDDLVVLVDDQPLGPAEFARYEILEASPEEWALLERHRFIETSQSTKQDP